VVVAWGDIVVSGDADPAVLSRAVQRGTLRRLATGVYTGLVHVQPEQVVATHLWTIVGHQLPGAVVVDRSARAAGAVNGLLVLDHPRSRPLELPGVTVLPRSGPGEVNGDMPFMNHLYLSSTARQLLDNLDRVRGSQRRTLTNLEVEEWIDDLIRERGEAGLNRLRDQARALAPALGRHAALARLEAVVSAALSTGDLAAVRSPRLLGRAAGSPVDALRLHACEQLAEALADQPPDVIAELPADLGRRRLLPFYEAYFSNFIEGTEFTLEEAASIVFDDDIPPDRPNDAHDILGTYEIVADQTQMMLTPQTAEEFETVLRARHARVMAGRPEKLPGSYKKRANRAGSSEFVDPALVAGTLRHGFDIGNPLSSPFERAVYLMFLVSEVHPFADGNGRVARIMMNAELVAGGEVRAVIPIVYRANYLSALKAATHTGHFGALIKTLSFARRYTAQVDFTDRQSAEGDLRRTNALRDAGEAEDAGIRLLLPLRAPS
jgi:hypothetical protein